MNLKPITLILTILILAFFINPIQAISAGVSPPKITIENVVPGNTYNITLTVYNMGNETTLYSAEPMGNISNWTFLDKTKVEVQGNGTYGITGVITVPSNANNESYTGNILIKSIPSGNVTGNKVSVGVNLPIRLNMTKYPSTSIDIINNTSNNTNSSQNKASPGFGVFVVIAAFSLIYLKKKL